MIREITDKETSQFNTLAPHPLQSWEWGQFRESLGTKVIRLGKFQKDTLVETSQFTIHPIPHTKWTVGYLPKNIIPSEEMITALSSYGKKYNCIFIKIEPNVVTHQLAENRLTHHSLLITSKHPLFTKYTFQLDLTKSENELLQQMNQKTRYNIRVAQKHGVTIQEEDSDEAFEAYLKLTFETTKRQQFYAHDPAYHKTMWDTMRKSGIAHLLTARYNDQILVTWIVFLFNNILYYPYGASSSAYRNVMASNLMMWEAIRWGKSRGATLFDMWGALGSDPDPKDEWIGFHKFKQGYGAKHIEMIGSYDLVINPVLYTMYSYLYKIRSIFLHIKNIFR